MKIGIIVAMEKEREQLERFFGENVVLRMSGIGKVNAALGAANLIREEKPDVIISSGCAGGNGDEVNVQDVVVSEELAYHDVYCGAAIGDSVYGQVQGLPARFPADPYMLAKAKSLNIPDAHFKIHSGLIVTGDWFVDSKQKAREIVSHFPEAKAIDMESTAIAHTCFLHHVPFISFRVISDIPLRDTDASQYHNFWDTIAANSFEITKAFVESL